MNKMCEQWRNMILLSASGECSDEQRRELDEHLLSCADCRDFARDAQLLTSVYIETQQDDMNVDRSDSLLGALVQSQEEPIPGTMTLSRRFWLMALATAACAMFIVSLSALRPAAADKQVAWTPPSAVATEPPQWGFQNSIDLAIQMEQLDESISDLSMEVMFYSSQPDEDYETI
ncbi:MAG: zf-HC2 domain-containing protein [Spartobacteria bacterium]|nr:zf-HC2 domain-containing protein [Spartobacteria bacterium]